MAGYQQYPRKEVSQEMEIGTDISTNYTTDQPYEVTFNF